MGYDHASKKTAGSHIHQMDEHFHSADRCFPTLAAGTVIADGGPAFAEAPNPTQIIPAGAITESFDIHFINVEAATAQETFEVSLWSGPDPGVEIARRRVTIILNVGNVLGLVSYPTLNDPVLPNTRISAKVADNTGGISLTLSLQYHLY